MNVAVAGGEVRLLKQFGLAVVLFVGLAGFGSAAHAGSWEDGMAAFARKEYAAAMKLLRPLAEKGNAFAQYRIALMHKMGFGVNKDQREAKKWSRLAARQGNSDAQVLLGSLYYTKEGNESPDVMLAYMWYEVSASLGNADASREIALISRDMTPRQIVEAREKAQKCKASGYELCE